MESKTVTPPITILTIKKIIVHEFKKDNSLNEFVFNFSEAIVELEQNTEEAISVKINELLHKAIPMQIQSENKIFDIVKQIPNMTSDQEFIKQSQTVTEKLILAQMSAPKARDGVLIAIHAINPDEQDVVLIIKSEFGAGIRATFSHDQKAHMKLFNKMIFTRTNYYKIGAFLYDGNEWHCRLWDSGARKPGAKETAKYFYATFLELDIMRQDANRTYDFYRLSKEFICKNYDNYESLTKTEILYSYLKLPEPIIGIREFANMCLPEHKDKYMKYMKEKARLSGNFQKDMSLTKKEIKTRKIYFDGGINIQVPDDKYDSDIVFLSDKDIPSSVKDDKQWTYIKIKGKIRSEK